MLLTKAVSIVLMPIYTRLLTPTDYGVLALIWMTFEVVTIFAGSRIAIGVFHFYHKATDERERRAVLSTSFLLLATAYAVAAAVTVWVAPRIALLVFGSVDPYTTLIRLAAVSMAFEGQLLVPLALLQLQGRSTAFVVVALARLSFQVVVTLILLISFDMGVMGVLWGGVITHAILGVLLSVRLLSGQGSRVDASIVRDLVRFGLPLVIMQVATFVATFGDRYFLNRAGTTADVGLYGLAYQFGFLVATVGYAPFAQVWEAQRFGIAKRADREAIFADVFVYLNVMLISTALGIALFAGDALRVIATPDFHTAAVFVPLLAAAYVLQSWGLFLNLGMYITERTEYFTVANWVAAIVAMGGFLWLIPRWVVWGAVVTTLVSKAVLCGLVYLFSQRLWPVKYRWRRVVQIAGLAIGAGVLAELLPPLSFWMSVSLHAGLFLTYAALVWTLVLTGDERRVVSGGLRSRLPLPTPTT